MQQDDWMLPIVAVRVNGINVGTANVNDFFSKYGNCDGSNYVGLVAEAYLVKLLREHGYKVLLVVSHNIEIRRIERETFSYDCTGDYVEVLDKMPAVLRSVVDKFCEKGLDITLPGNIGVPVYFRDRLLFQADIKSILTTMIAKAKNSVVSRMIMFDPHMEPFTTALGIDLYYLVESAGIQLLKTPPERLPKLLELMENVLREKMIFLEEDLWEGFKISNEKDLVNMLKSAFYNVFDKGQ
ncbi:MAG: hypothetical protein QW470_07705 [Candidatus Caldarchaeum sp.]